MGEGAAVAHQGGNDVLAEIVAGMRVGGIVAQHIEQELGLEHVDAHAGQRQVGVVGHARRLGRFLQEVDDAVVGVDIHHPEAGGLRPRHLQAAHGHVRAGLDMLHQHGLVIHLVDVVTGQQHDEFGVVALDDIDVLEHRVRGAEVPFVLRHALAGGQDVEALVALGAEEVPAALQVADQAVRLVLRRHGDAADAGVQRVGQCEVDDAQLAAEIHRRLGAVVGQLQQPCAAASGQHIGHGVAGKRAAGGCRRAHGRSSGIVRWSDLVGDVNVLPATPPGSDTLAHRHVPDVVAILADGAIRGEPADIGGVDRAGPPPRRLVAPV